MSEEYKYRATAAFRRDGQKKPYLKHVDGNTKEELLAAAQNIEMSIKTKGNSLDTMHVHGINGRRLLIWADDRFVPYADRFLEQLGKRRQELQAKRGKS